MIQDVTKGEKLCAAQDLAFADVFSQQFRITKSKSRPLPGFRQLTIGAWRIEVGHDLPACVVNVDESAVSVAFLGIAVDGNGAVVTETQLRRPAKVDDIIEYLNACSGRFAYLIINEKGQWFYGDPSGGLGAVFDPENECIAATLNLVISRDLIPNDTYPLASLAASSKARFAFGHTADKVIKRVLPNHYLDLSDFTLHRFWPRPDDIQPVQPNGEMLLVSKITARLRQVVTSLSGHFPDTKMPLSGGIDSRVLMATAKPVLGRIALYSHAESMMSRRDTRIAGKLASAIGQNISIYDPKVDPSYQINDQDTLNQLSRANYVAIGHGDSNVALSKVLLEVLQAVPKGGLVLRANLVDFLKAVLWRRGMSEYTNDTAHDMNTGLRMMMLADRETMNGLNAQDKRALLESYEIWYGGLNGLAAKRPFDMMFSEQFLSHGIGNQFYAYTRNFYLCPFNDRALLSMAMSLPPDRRGNLHYTEEIIANCAPEIQQMKYTRKSTTSHVRERQKIGLDWYLKRD